MSENSDDEVLSGINQCLDESVQDIDAETRSALNQIRQKAITTNPGRRTRDIVGSFAMRAVPLGSFAAAAALVVFWVTTPGIQQIDAGITQPVVMEEALLAEELAMELAIELAEEYWQEDPELIENLEFVAWLIDDEMINGEASSVSNFGDQYAG